MDANERSKRIELLRVQREQLRARMNSLLGKVRAEENKKAARKAKRLGELLLVEAEKNEKTKSWITQFLDKRLTSAGDRALFDLPTSTPQPSVSATGHNPNSAAH